jgi:PAS domain S-box-containing protein
LIPERYRTKHPIFRNIFFESPMVRSMGVGRELFALKKDNTEFPIEIGLNPLVTVDGTLILASIIDISERKKAEERFRLVVESAPNAMVLVNNAGSITFVNKQTETLFGYGRDELIGNRLEMLIPERFRSRHPDHRTGYFVSPQTRSMGEGRELFALRKDGSEIQVEIGLNPIETSEGSLVLASIINISERKKAEERFQLVVESAPNAMVLINSTGTITFVNKQTETLFGYKRGELVGNRIEVLIPSRFRSNHPDHRNQFFVSPQTRSMGEGRDLFALRKDGTEIQVEIGLNPIDSSEGPMVLASIINITERKIQELTAKKQVALEIRNKELEQFAYLASHDLQEPLRTVSNYIQIFLEDYNDHLDKAAHEYLNSMNDATRRMSMLVQALLDYSRLGRNKKLILVDCNELVKNVIKDIKIMVDTSRANIDSALLPTMHGYEVEMRQLFQNLITNAIKFQKTNTTPVIHISAQEKEDKWQFCVTDNGIGIDAGHFDRIFNMFQRLHSPDEFEGHGIGLANCKKIVDLHQGEIWIESTPGKGSKFLFTIAKKLV